MGNNAVSEVTKEEHLTRIRKLRSMFPSEGALSNSDAAILGLALLVVLADETIDRLEKQIADERDARR